MARYSARRLKQYVRDCEVLYEDITRLIDDLSYEHDGGTVRYAIDFAEIHAYVFPDESAEDMRIFSDDDADWGRLSQHFILNKLLFKLPHKLLLLKPYMIELESFVDRLRLGDVETLVTDVAAALDEVRKIVTMPEFKRVSDLAAALEQPDKRASILPADAHEVLAFFESHASRLLLLLERTDSAPRQRLRTLLRSGRFEDLSSCGADDLDVAEDVIGHWDSRLRELRVKRPAAASYLDALAIATIKAANERLAASNTKVCLVTRSKAMYTVFQEELDAGLWDGAGGRILKHPRSFGPLHAVEGQSLAMTLKHLDAMRKSLSAFLMASYGELSAPAEEGSSIAYRRSNTDWNTVDLEQHMQQIKAQWHINIGLSSSITENRGVGDRGPAPTDSMNAIERVVHLFTLASNQHTLNTLLKNRIAELTEEMDRDYQYLGVAVQSPGLQHQEVVEQHIQPETFGNKTILTSSLSHMPCTLQFYSDELKNWSQRATETQRVTLQNMLELFHRGFDTGRDYEILLLIAYVFGAWNRWQLAEIYCDLALSERNNATDPAPHEGLFFQAVCVRMQAQGRPDWYLRAWRLLEDATRNKAVARNDPGYKDPRFLKEQVAIITAWHLTLHGETASKAAPPPIALALDLSRQALALIGDDHKLRAQIHDTLCSFFIALGDDKYRDEAHKQFEALVQTQQAIEGDESQWPPTIIDTVVWARWTLREQVPGQEEQQRMITDLENALARMETKDSLRMVVQDHLRTIRQISTSSDRVPVVPPQHHPSPA